MWPQKTFVMSLWDLWSRSDASAHSSWSPWCPSVTWMRLRAGRGRDRPEIGGHSLKLFSCVIGGLFTVMADSRFPVSVTAIRLHSLSDPIWLLGLFLALIVGKNLEIPILKDANWSKKWTACNMYSCVVAPGAWSWVHLIVKNGC